MSSRSLFLAGLERKIDGVKNNLKSTKPVTTIVNPSTEDAKDVIQDALRKTKAVILVGSCRILYRGRASSTLEPGERIVLITEDKALLIHRSYGYRAVNWQPTGCKFRVELSSDKQLKITAVRTKPLESVNIAFNELYLVCILDLLDEKEICMYGSELEMKRAILYDPSLVEEGFSPITSEKELPTGFMDIFGKDRNGNYTIVEIKRGKATRNAALQLARYVETLRKQDPHVRGILVAEKMAKGTQRSIASLSLEYRQLSPKKCSEILRRVERNEKQELSDFF